MIALCIGRKEQGKTTLGYHLVSSMPQRVVFDPRERFKTTDLIADGLDVYDALEDNEPEIIVYSAEFTTQKFEETCRDVAEWAKANPEKKFGFLVDEVGLALDDGIPEKFQWLTKATKIDQARIVMTTWRPTEVPPLIRSQIDHWFIFKTTEPRDLETIEEKCGTETVALVQKLPPHHFVHCDDSHAERKIDVFGPNGWHVNVEIFNPANKPKIPRELIAS